MTADINAIIALAADRVDPITLIEIEEAIMGRGAGLLLLVLSIPFILPIPIPLLATACGIPMIAIGLKLAVTGVGALPDRFYRAQVSPQTLQAAAKGLRRLLQPVAWLFQPRLGVMFWAGPWRLIGLSIVLAAFLLSLPIPIPFANLIPALGLIFFASGLLQRDGLAICIGHALTAGSYLYLYFVWEEALELLKRLLAG